MSDLVFLDIETTGLDPARHQVWEIAYALNDEPIESSWVEHSALSADSAALEVSRYLERLPELISYRRSHQLKFEAVLKIVLEGATIVGANPAFDTAFLRARWLSAPWHYRLLDVESYAMPHLGLDRPRGLAFIAEQFGIKAPDHSAAGDVAAVRECFYRLRRIYEDLDLLPGVES